MEFGFNETQQMIMETARDYAEKEILPRIDEVESGAKFPADLFAKMAEIGLLGVNLPEEFGGVEAGYVAECAAIEELGKISGSGATLLTVALLPMEAMCKYGTQAQKEKYVPRGIEGKEIGSFAFTEAGTGSDPKQLITTAKKVGDHYEITGVKRFISNAAYEGPIVIFANEEETGECTAFIAQKFSKGYSISTPWEKVGFHGSNIYDIFLDGVEVKEEDILGEHGKGFEILLGATAYGKLSFSAVFTGAMEGAYELALKYAKEKMHRGKPIGKFPTIQSKIAQIAANTTSARLMLYKSAYDADTLTDVKKVQASTALSKGYIADLAVETNVMSLNILGSYGVTTEYKIERYLRDSLIAPNIEGSADIQRLIAGSYLLRN